MDLRRRFSRKKDEDKKKDEEDPWTQPHEEKKKEEDPGSFGTYLKGVYKDFDRRVSSDVGFLGRKKIHIRFLRQTKRVIATGLFFFYLIGGFAATMNPFFAPLSATFLITAYLMLDYLWKSRKVSWEKKQ